VSSRKKWPSSLSCFETSGDEPGGIGGSKKNGSAFWTRACAASSVPILPRDRVAAEARALPNASLPKRPARNVTASFVRTAPICSTVGIRS
jgi:hypothetical protein